METGGLNLKGLQTQFEEEIKKVQTEEDLLRLKSAYLGKKGHISLFLRGLGDLPVESRPLYGAQANDLKERIERECRALLEELVREKKEKKLKEEGVDVTLPGRFVEPGGLHPITRMLEEVETIFREIGFSVFEGPEIESDYYNFEALNIPKDHPARDMQDTFYLGDPCGPEGGYPCLSDSGRASDVPQAPAPRTGKARSSALLLRTHTSPVQIHVMKKTKPPIRMIAPGVVYRRDSDISHTPMFHQVEGLEVGKGIRFSDLKGVVTHLIHRLFGEMLPVRFRPSYFPFTEPSAEVDIQCVVCRGRGKVSRVNGGRFPSGVNDLTSGIRMGGSGGEAVSPPAQEAPCRLCKTTGWLEVIGCGMVHPAVFENVGYDPKKWSGYAFGMGIERLTMLKHGIPDIRLFFENDLRFLRQF